ncbi:MAG: YceI family protein [Proteobacteria bacterium]|nr:YceI family protein [Pseudomonadota bacterium]
MKKINFLILLLLLSACSKKPAPSSSTQWTLDTTSSYISYISTKNKTIDELNTLKFSHGMIKTDGHVSLSVDLNSVETNMEIRNERVRDMLFEVEKYLTAQITADIGSDILSKQQANIPITLDLHGFQKTFNSSVVIDQHDNKLTVTSYTPITVNAKDFALDEGINQLTSIVNLKSISYTVPVDFKLVFKQ